MLTKIVKAFMRFDTVAIPLRFAVKIVNLLEEAIRMFIPGWKRKNGPHVGHLVPVRFHRSYWGVKIFVMPGI